MQVEEGLSEITIAMDGATNAQECNILPGRFLMTQTKVHRPFRQNFLACRQIKPLYISYYRLVVPAGIGCNIAPKGKKLLVVKVQFLILVHFSEEISEVYRLYRYGKRKYECSGTSRFLTSIIHAEFKMDTLDLDIQPPGNDSSLELKRLLSCLDQSAISQVESMVSNDLLIDVRQNCKVMGSRYQQATTLHIIIFLQITHLVTGQYKIIPPDKPVIGVIGKGVILPCQLKDKIIPERLSVQWVFTGNSEKKSDVTTYYGKNTHNPVHEYETYQGRTNFFQSEFNKGNVSLHLKNVMLSDKGKYICSVFFENWYDEVVVDLDVAAKGDESSVFLDGHVGQGIGVTCKSQGWFPEPKVVWLNSKGQTRKEEVTTQSTKTSSGLFDVVSSMNLKPGSDKEISCRVVNNLLNAMCESRVLISDVFFPSTSPWMTAFLVILFLNIAVVAAIGYKLNKRLKAELDFWEARSHAVPITVNPDCRVLELQVPGAPGVESHASEPAGPNTPSTVPILVAKEGFAAGKHYWEVEVGQQQDWVLGVVREKGRQEEEGEDSWGGLPGEDYWALHRSQGEIFSSEGDRRIEKQQMRNSVLGVLLDLEEGQVNFYEAEQMALMVRMPLRLGKEPAEMFYPFLSKREGTLTPLIHPVLIPVPLQAL
ncbi:butyrophilin-like protein 8 [Mycteria americana]|uniref:butyrophilin-like protein 8 n=1 Tax=Mycteria americana TaxID=33587 RepID=UPI003F580B01